MKKKEFELLLEKSLAELEDGISLQDILKSNSPKSKKVIAIIQTL